MSTILIVSICVAIAALIGLRVYFEYRQEDDKQVENIGKEEDAFYDLQAFVTNPQEPTVTPVAETPNPTFVDVEPVNSAAAVKEVKQRKKKRYYGNKGRGRKPKTQKQTNKNN